VRLVTFLSLLVLALPVTAASQTVAGQVAFGVRHAIALRTNGDVITWGNNVGCQLGRRTGNRTGDPGLVLRNGVHVAAAADHSVAVTRDGHVYAWGTNGEGQLGVGNEFDQCEGPTLVESLEGKGIVQVDTGQDFTVALSRSGELFCAGANDMGQCPTLPAVPNDVFRPVTLPSGVGAIDAVSAGAFHTLARTKDGRLFAYGRGRDGQLGNNGVTNGAGVVAGVANVVSFDAGIWHSAAVTADGAAWVWGNNSRSQLCDGTTTNRTTPVKVALPVASKVARVTAGGFGTLMQAADGALFACGDNQFGGLGAGTPIIVATPTPVTTPAVTSGVLVAAGNYAAVSVDACAVRMTGDSGEGVVNPTGYGTRTFVPRVSLSLCGPRATTTLADVVNPAPRGGMSGCWAPAVNEDAATSPRFAGLNQAMTAAEDILKKNPAFVAPLEQVRWRSSKSAGPTDAGGARIHVKVVPERKIDGTRLWTAGCGVIPQLDRIGGAISQISVFFNIDPVVGPSGEVPKLTGRAGGFPEYDNWVLITKDGRLPWVPVTLAEKLDVEGEKRERALAEWKSSIAGMRMPDEATMQKTYEMLKKSDPAGAEKMLTSVREQREELARLQRDVYPLQTASLERQLQEYRRYRASQSADALRSPAVRGDPSGDGKRQLDAEVTRLRALPAADQQQVDALTKQGRPQEARAVRQAHTERSAPLITEAIARYDLTNLQAGPAERAISVKADPTFPNVKEPNRIQLIAVLFSMDPNTRNTERRAWQQRVKDTFDYAALAALLK
jgi:alpha-tubulin suppressor-like RCC1 family protein